jgi:carboxyl-terminal processing protease
VVKAPPVDFKMLESGIAYVHVPILSQGKAAEARKDIDDLIKRGATSVVLDLRATAGGDESEGVALANVFMDSGTVGYSQGRKSEKRTLPIDPSSALTKMPVAVLVNFGTSGPAELIAGAIRDNKRGQVVGTTTFGNGSIQKLIPMDDGAALLLAVARYYTPSGKDIEEVGVEPQVQVQAQEEEVINFSSDQEIEAPVAPKKPTPAANEDLQLNKAIEILKAPIAASKPA